MNRTEFEQFILAWYPSKSDCPWASHPRHKVFRHRGNRKWFALIMNVSRDKLGLSGSDMLDVVNLKCDPLLIPSLRERPGCFPAYHMNKAHWITVALDDSASDETIKMLLDMSYAATESNACKGKS